MSTVAIAGTRLCINCELGGLCLGGRSQVDAAPVAIKTEAVFKLQMREDVASRTEHQR